MNKSNTPFEVVAIAKDCIEQLIELSKNASDWKQRYSVLDALVFNFRSPKIITEIVRLIKMQPTTRVSDKLVYYASECRSEETAPYFDLWIQLVCNGEYSVALNAYHILSEITDPDFVSKDQAIAAEKALRSSYSADDEKAVIINDLLQMFD